MKKIIITVLILVMPQLRADYSFQQSINKTLTDKTALVLAGLSIVFLTRAKTILDYSGEYAAENFINGAYEAYREDLQQRGEANVPESIPLEYRPKKAEVVLCTGIGACFLLALANTFINNGFQ